MYCNYRTSTHLQKSGLNPLQLHRLFVHRPPLVMLQEVATAVAHALILAGLASSVSALHFAFHDVILYVHIEHILHDRYMYATYICIMLICT